jgi:hypothetical protein
MKIIYPDGSCLNCQFGAATNPAFKPDGTVISFIQNGRLTLDKIDAIRNSSRPSAPTYDAVWSAAGQLAAVRRGGIWAGRPGRLTRIGIGTEPSWSPDGALIAATQRGWIVIIRRSDHRIRRLVRGTSPAFSPDGRWIAYVAPDHRLMIIRASGAHLSSRRVGNIHAVSADWQPKPHGSHPACAAPPGSSVLASSPEAVVTGDGLPLPPLDFSNAPAIAYMGCLRADGRERLLEHFPANSVDGAYSVGSAVLAAPYAGLVLDFLDAHYGAQSSTLQVFDLRAGRLQPKLGGESAGCPGFGVGPCSGLGQVVLGSDGLSAAESQTVEPVGGLSTPLQQVSCAPATATCVAAGSTGQLFTSTDPAGGAQAWTAATIVPPPAIGPSAVSCPSTSLCVASQVQIYTSTNPTGGASAWTSTALGGTASYVNDLNCPSTNLCVATRLDGSVAVSTNPSGGTGAWSASAIDSNRSLNAVFCSAQPECFITDSSRTVFTSADPTGPASAWTVSTSTPPFESGTCPTTTFCVSVDGQNIQTTTAPGAGSWTKQVVADNLVGIACPSTALCLAVGSSGALDVSTDPASGAWTHTTIDNGRNLSSIACPSASLCVAVDSTGHVVSSSDPTGGPSAWTPALLAGDPCTDTTPCSIEQVQASDGTGLHTVDSSKIPGNGPFLTALALTGDVLSWNHDGTQRSDPLTP